MRIPTLIAATIIALSISAASPATAKPTDPMDDLVAAALEATPGGTRTGWNEVAWDDGDIVLTLADPATRTGATAKAVGGCASGKFCAYTLPGYLGNKLTFSTCTSNHGVSALGGSVRSIANSRSSGTVKAYNGSSLVLSVSAGTGKNTTATITKLACS